MAIELKKGDKCIVKGFTGIKLGVFEVAAASKKTITVMKRNGDEMIFDKKTGRQVNVEEGKERFANSIMDDDGSYTAPNRGSKKASKKDKAPAKKVKPAPVEEDEEEEEEEEEAPAPTKKSKKATPTKKSKKAPVIEEDDDEEDDDDDFEEIDD